MVRSFWYTDLDPETERLIAAALKNLQHAGVELVESELPELPRLISLTTDVIQNHDVRQSLTRYLMEYHTGVSFEQLLAQASPDVRVMIVSALEGGPDFVSVTDPIRR